VYKSLSSFNILFYSRPTSVFINFKCRGNINNSQINIEPVSVRIAIIISELVKNGFEISC